jgi:hypothetical protein
VRSWNPNRAIVATAAAIAAVVVALSLGGARAATTPPYEPDPHAEGTLTFFDASGNVVTSGHIDDRPFATYVQASHAGRAGDNKATLFGYLPKSGQDPGAFAGETMSASSVYPNSSAPGALGSSPLPLVKLTANDLNLADLQADFPNTATDAYKGLYQLRVKTSGEGQPPGDTYSASDVFIDGDTWTQVYPDPGSAPSTTTTIVGDTTTTAAPSTTTTLVTTSTTVVTSTTTTPSTTSTTARPATTTTALAPSSGNTTPTTLVVAGALVRTGTDSRRMATLGTLLVLLGAAIVGATYRRRIVRPVVFSNHHTEKKQ